MKAKDEKFKIEVRFSKNRHYPEYGNNSYSIEGHTVLILKSAKLSTSANNINLNLLRTS